MLFLLFVDVLSPATRLFVDDCVFYRRIRSSEDQMILHRYIDILQRCEEDWVMRFDPHRCEVQIYFPKRKSSLRAVYAIHGQVLNVTDSARYPGLNIQQSLNLDNCINRVTTKTNVILVFLRRNTRRYPANIKAKCYSTLIRPIKENASTIWSLVRRPTLTTSVFSHFDP